MTAALCAVSKALRIAAVGTMVAGPATYSNDQIGSQTVSRVGFSHRPPICVAFANAPRRAALRTAACEVIRAEKASGSRRDGRTGGTGRQVLLDFCSRNTPIVICIDRLARSIERPVREKRFG